MGSCSSTPKLFDVRIPVDTITVFPSDYMNCGVPSPSIYPVTITKDTQSSTLIIYEIIIGDANSFNRVVFGLRVEKKVGIDVVQILNHPKGVDIYVNLAPRGRKFDGVTIKLQAGSSLFRGTYVVGDIYDILLNNGLGVDLVIIAVTRPETEKVEYVTYGTFAAPATTVTTTNIANTSNFIMSSMNCIGNTCDTTMVPQINIAAQTTINGSDVGDAIFTVFDEFDYQNYHPIPENTCAIRFIDRNDVKETVFRQCCPYMVSVIRGKGKTFYDRILSIYNKIGEIRIGVDFVTFYRFLVLYGMAKYILSRLLYGDFNINYLLGKYNEKFLEDLGNSRFCAFIELFEDCESPIRGYNKYFKY